MASKRRWLMRGLIWLGATAPAVFGAFGIGAWLGIRWGVQAEPADWLYPRAVEMVRAEAQQPGGRNAAVLYYREWHSVGESDWGLVRRLRAISEERELNAEDLAQLGERSLSRDIDRYAAITAYADRDFDLEYERGFSAFHMHVPYMRLTGSLLGFDAERLALAGEGTLAADRLIARLRLARHLGGAQHVVSSMRALDEARRTAAVIERWSERGLFDADDAARLSDHLRDLAASDFGMLEALRMERLQGAITFAKLSSDDDWPPTPDDGLEPWEQEIGLRLGGTGARLTDGYEAALDLVIEAWPERDGAEQIVRASAALEAGPLDEPVRRAVALYAKQHASQHELRERLLELARSLDNAGQG
ncbi:MAG: hypothetical protein AAF995_00130 [Planctomycetota bacterium]